jgi:two-component sensor histidine kinase
VEVNVTVEDYHLDLDQGIACGLISNELVTNSLKHGLDDEGYDRIDITFGQTESDDNVLTVKDTGTGFDDNFDPEASSSTGLDIVNSLVDFELDGSIEYYNDHGAVVRVTF